MGSHIHARQRMLAFNVSYFVFNLLLYLQYFLFVLLFFFFLILVGARITLAEFVLLKFSKKIIFFRMTFTALY